MARLARPNDRPGDVAVALERVCVTAVALVGVTGAAVTLLTDQGVPGFAAASDSVSRRLEELQFTLGEGPSLDASGTGRPVLVPELWDGGQERWPMYCDAASALGVGAMFAFPIQVGGSRTGVLGLFRDRSGALTREEVGKAFTLADVALTLVLDAQRAEPGEVPRGFEEAPGFPAVVAQAQGMIMIQLGVSITEALVRLRAYAYAEGRPVSEVARDVVAKRIRFDERAP
jgi:hypothetical protein